jgi:hypothetical protein
MKLSLSLSLSTRVQPKAEPECRDRVTCGDAVAEWDSVPTVLQVYRSTVPGSVRVPCRGRGEAQARLRVTKIRTRPTSDVSCPRAERFFTKTFVGKPVL